MRQQAERHVAELTNLREQIQVGYGQGRADLAWTKRSLAQLWGGVGSSAYNGVAPENELAWARVAVADHL